MAFFSQKVLRTVPGNWTFLVITDRNDLDKQIYTNFANTSVVNEDCQAESGAHLRQLLTEDHRFIFTLIQKFGTKPGETFPVLSLRHNIIVIIDEAHRTQYDTLALNLRNALPNAAFIAFTGTPLMAGEERKGQQLCHPPRLNRSNLTQKALPLKPRLPPRVKRLPPELCVLDAWNGTRGRRAEFPPRCGNVCGNS